MEHLDQKLSANVVRVNASQGYGNLTFVDEKLFSQNFFLTVLPLDSVVQLFPLIIQ